MFYDCREDKEEEQDDVEQEKVEQNLVQEDEEERIKEESRKRKQAIIEKYRQKQMQNQQLESRLDSSSKGTLPSIFFVVEIILRDLYFLVLFLHCWFYIVQMKVHLKRRQHKFRIQMVAI